MKARFFVDLLDCLEGVDLNDPDAVMVALDDLGFHCCELEADDEGICGVCGHIIPTGSAFFEYFTVDPFPDTY